MHSNINIMREILWKIKQKLTCLDDILHQVEIKRATLVLEIYGGQKIC